MSITNSSYFKGEIYIPNAKTGLSTSITDVEAKVQDFIDEYEQECLEYCFGLILAKEFFSNLDSAQPTFIKTGSDAKWNDLLNGKTYTKDGESFVWKGIRRKKTTLGATEESTVYDKSFLADYVYFFYESNSFITRANAGSGKNKSANMESVMPNNKVIKSWRRFVKIVQGINDQTPHYYLKLGIFEGDVVDYRREIDKSDVSLYQFVKDMNILSEDTYAKFKPRAWKMINQFTI
jgi:hypothetical protein